VKNLKDRTREYAVSIIQFCTALQRTTTAQVLAKQLLRAGTSVGANYREATRARTRAEFVSKIEVAIQEVEETRYWLELLFVSKTAAPAQLQLLINETDELAAILVTIAKRTKTKLKRPPR
jgi:four helix bundle protein